MTDLESGNGAELLDGGTDARQALNLRIIPQANVAMGDAPFRRHTRRLDHHQTKAAQGKFAIVDQVVISHVAVHSLVLAHGGDGEPVAQGDATQAQVFK